MDRPKNVQISYQTFLELLELLEYIDMSNYTDDFKLQFNAVLEVLRAKKRSLERREAYTAYKTSYGDQRDEQRIEYLKLKRNQDF